MAYNFNSGPARLPNSVIEEARMALSHQNHLGLSILGLSHRDKRFENIVEESKETLTTLLNIPDNYHILFLHGGACSQLSMIPMNILQEKRSAAHCDTGIWSRRAIDEAKQFCHVNIACSVNYDKSAIIPPTLQWTIHSDDAYLHYTDNETADGLEFPEPPNVSNITLVSDMSSNFLSRPVDVAKFGVIYACAQKNIGPAGITVVIIRKDLVSKKVLKNTPAMFRYYNHVEKNSQYNTPPIFNWYVTTLMLKWTKKQGGVETMDYQNKIKSNLLYHFIDQSDLYQNKIHPAYRSRMNITFALSNPNLTYRFITIAEKLGFYGIGGHPQKGGLRVALYNSIPLSHVHALIDFMRFFEKKHG